MELQVSLFHELQIVQQAKVLPALPYRVQNLLALLLLRPQLRRREQIVDVLFPDASLRQGRKQLSDLLYQLRKALPDAQITVDREHAFIDATTRRLDVDVFRGCLQATEVERRAEGARLYRGDLLMSSYEDWLIEEWEILRMGFVNMAHRLCERLVEQIDTINSPEALLEHARSTLNKSERSTVETLLTQLRLQLSQPYQLPVPNSPLATVLTPTWDDAPNTCCDPATNDYVVRSVCIGAHTDGGERAEFDFALSPGH